MTRIYVGPTTLYALGGVGELDLLDHFDGRLVVPEVVVDAVTTEPARTALAEYLGGADVSQAVPEQARERASARLGLDADGYEAALLAGVLAHADPDDRTAVAVVSEDRRVRRLAEGLGAAVTGSVGVVARAAAEDKYLSRGQAKRVVRRMDRAGVVMTGEMRERVVGEIEQ